MTKRTQVESYRADSRRSLGCTRAIREILRCRALPRVLALLAILSVDAPGSIAQTRLNRFETRYYIIHTDLSAADVREAEVRISRIAEEYHARTKSFAGQIVQKLPFYLFSRHEDYLAAGGLPGSAGVFMGDKLMATVPTGNLGNPWYIIQHEGFHQFADAVIRGDLPPWVNEGLAEYFERAVFTGDGYVAAVIPPVDLARVKRWLEDGRFKSMRDMMTLGREVWNHQMSRENYDQAWSMVHFLAHADNGRYQGTFDRFLRETGRGRPWQLAWEKTFGRGVGEFEAQWRDYWLNLPDDPTAKLYARATVATLTSFLARAVSQGQRFGTVEEFFKTASQGGLKSHPDDWLPPSILNRALRSAKRTGTWTFAARGGALPRLTCELEDGATLVGAFKMAKRKVKSVSVTEGRSRR
ncbi:MAG: DUF1570 domain-containing protein [Planctomycetes bacterium]|nr:DUF1570 domain-containing protein [Planctomycetota bacterium]